MAKVWTETVRARPGDLFPIVTIGRRWAPIQDLYHRILDLRWASYFLLIAIAFGLANATFAALYLLQPGSIANADGSFRDAFFFSVQTLATIGYGSMAPATLYAHILVTSEALSGLLGFALITGVTFSKFARPRARVLFSKKIAVGSRNGQTFVMFRMANERHNQIVEAQLRVLLLQETETEEGERLRVPSELPLLRDRTSFFRLSWTATHKVDEKSPFYGPNAAADLAAKKTEIYLSLTGLDETISQTVHARYAYSLDDIAWGSRFKDVISGSTGGARVIDYRWFHDVVPEGPAKSAKPKPAEPKGDAASPSVAVPDPVDGGQRRVFVDHPDKDEPRVKAS
jgi:inward rectifier potassium channel